MTMQNSRKEKKQIDLATIACSVFPVLRVFSGCFSPLRETSPSPEVCPFSGSQVQLFRILFNPFRKCCVVSLRLSLRCAVHTATCNAAFREDRPSGRGRQLHPALRTERLLVVPRSPGARARSLAWLFTTWLRAATSVSA